MKKVYKRFTFFEFLILTFLFLFFFIQFQSNKNDLYQSRLYIFFDVRDYNPHLDIKNNFNDTHFDDIKLIIAHNFEKHNPHWKFQNSFSVNKISRKLSKTANLVIYFTKPMNDNLNILIKDLNQYLKIKSIFSIIIEYQIIND